jgi:hypothetical protein
MDSMGRQLSSSRLSFYATILGWWALEQGAGMVRYEREGGLG